MHLSVTRNYAIVSNISKIGENNEYNSIVKRSTIQADNRMLDAYMKFINYPIKTVGEYTFCNYYTSYNYFEIS